MTSIKQIRELAGWKIFRNDDRLLLVVLAVVVGTGSGLAALALNGAITWMFETLHHLHIYWWAVFLPAGGAALSAVFLEKIVKEGAGHGVPEVIYSVSRYGGLLRLRSSFSRLISACLTIGSGGSAGPEAPVVMSGASIGSNIARFFSLNDRQRVTLVGCGAAGAISSIFNAPIAGMVFSIEVILGEWKAPNIIPIAIASVAGAEISRILRGNQIVFTHQTFGIDLIDILACIGLALVTAASSVALTRILRKNASLANKVPAPKWLLAGGGGLVVGMIGVSYPVVLGEGYHSIQAMIGGIFTQGLGIVAIALAAKIIATALTLGWGGSGGIFAPCLVIGSLSGLVYHRALTLIWPAAQWVDEGCFALLGMAGLVSGILQAPLTGIFLIVEISGGYNVILPLIIVSAISTTLCHYVEPASFYLKDLVERGELLRPGTDARVLSDLRVGELLETDCLTVHPTMLFRDFLPVLKRSRRNYFPVEEAETGKFLGIIQLDDIRPYLFDPGMYDMILLSQIMKTGLKTVDPDDEMLDVLNRMDALGLYSMPVVADDRFMGMISKATILDRYRRELMVQTNI